MRIQKTVELSMGHRLINYQGPCAHPHGHNYMITATVSSAINKETGFVMDFKDLKAALQGVLAPFDHAMCLHNEDDDMIEFLADHDLKFVTLDANPTAENLAQLWFRHIQLLLGHKYEVTVTVEETRDSAATSNDTDTEVHVVQRS